MKMKKILCLSALLIGFSALASCGGKTDTKNVVEISGQTLSFYTDDTLSFDGVVELNGTKTTDYTVDTSAVDMNTPGTYTVKITCGGVTKEYTVTIKAHGTAQGIEIGTNTKTEYVLNEEFSMPEVFLVMSDGEKQDVSSKANVRKSAYKGAEVGTYTIWVLYEGFQTSYTVSVAKSTVVQSIEVENQTVEFAYGTEFTFNGVVKATYTDGYTEEITTGYDVDSTDYKKNEAGEYTIRISYQNKFTTYTAKVLPSTVVEKLEFADADTKFMVGWDFVFYGTVNATYEDGRTEKTTNYTVDASKYNKNVAGEYDVVFTSNGTTGTLKVRVLAESAEVFMRDIIVTGQKTTFGYGDEFELENGIVAKRFSDGSTEALTENDYTLVCDDYEAYVCDDYTATATFGKYSYEYTVKVQPATKLKYLIIGNSYSDDTNRYMSYLTSGMNFKADDVLICNLYHGGCSIDGHWGNKGTKYYQYRDWTKNQNTTTGDSDTYNSTLEEGVTHEKWDYIIFQQASGSSGQTASYYNFDKLINYVETTFKACENYNPKVKFAFNMTWAYASTYQHANFQLYGNNQERMYESITDAVQQKVATNDKILFISPAGTAIQNARTSFMGDNLNRDGTHLSMPVGCMISAMSMFCTLTGYAPEDVNYNLSTIDAKHKQVIVESVKNAFDNKYSVTQSKM